MQVIARIPQVRVPGETPAPDPRQEGRPPRAARPARPARTSAGPRFKTADLQSWTVAGLATLALVAWGLASWNEANRPGRQRQPARIAAQPPSIVAPSRAIGP